MTWATRTFSLAAIGGALALVLSGCGSSGGTTVPSGLTIPAGVQTPAKQSQTCATRGGTLNVLNHEEFEHIDPGESYFVGDYQLLYAVQRPLYGYKPNSLKEQVPDLAESMPQISSDAKTITIHIRHGVHFSPPVNREVTSADVAYALERGANPNVANPYFSVLFLLNRRCRTREGRADTGYPDAGQVHARAEAHETDRARSSRRRSCCH